MNLVCGIVPQSIVGVICVEKLGVIVGPSVAQLVEHGACNARVVGSIPGTTHT